MTAPGRDLRAEGGSGSGAATLTGTYAASELRAGELVAGRFRIEQLLGMGGMGVVYRATDEQLNVPVALKLLRPELAARPDAFERFRQELLLARQVSSPHVVRIHDLVAVEGRWLISMDYVPGQSLEHHLDHHGPMAIDDAVHVMRQLALGLAAAHQRGVIHRDLKPANVLLTDALDAYIGDFGVARSAGVSGITGSGVVVGTPEYLSPEQARADPVDARSDLYALGLVLYEMLTCKLPFPGGTPAETLAQRIVRSPSPVSRDRADVPHWLVQVCARLLQLKPARRFRSAEELVRALETRRVPGQPPAPRTIAIAAALVAIVAGAIWFVRLPRPATAPTATTAPAATGEIPTPAIALDIALLPLIAAGDAQAPAAAAIGELIGQALLARGVAPDPPRVARALRQLGYDAAAAERHVARSAQVLGVSRVIAGRVEAEGARLRLNLRVFAAAAPDTPAREATSGWVTVDALPLAAQQLLSSLDIGGTPGRAGSWPQRRATLDLFGQGLIASAKDSTDDATSAFAETVKAEPAFATGWRARLEHLARVAVPGQAAAAATEALAALRTARGPEVDRVRALAELAGGDAAAAMRLVEPLAAAAPDHPAQVLLARAMLDNGDFAAARGQLERVVAADPQNADAWFLLGRAAILAGDAQRGVDEYLVRAQVAYTRLGDRRGQADALNALGIGFERLGQTQAAIDNFTRAAALREAFGDASGAAKSLRNLSSARAVRGEFDPAREALTHAQALLEGAGDQVGVADVLNGLGVLEEERGDYAKALDAYRQALELRQRLGDSVRLAESLINVGFCYYQTGEFDNAGVYFRQAQAAAEKSGDKPLIVRAQQSLAPLAIAHGEFTDARKLLDASLATAEERQMLEEAAVSLVTLAELDRVEGRIGAALTHAERAAALFAQRKDQRGEAEVALTRAAIYADVGAYEQAAQALAPLARAEPGSQEQLALLALRQSEVALGRRDAAGARREAQAAIDRAKGAHSLAVELPARLALARAAAAAGDRAAAGRELDNVARELTHYAPVPLALDFDATALAVWLPVKALPRYHDATTALAKLPSWGRAWTLHRDGSAALAATGAATEAAQAEGRMRVALKSLIDQTPEPLRAGLSGVATAPGTSP